MNNHDATPQPASAVARPEGASPQPRLPYSAPVLKLYGSVGKLTLSGGLSGAEGGSGMGMAPSEPELKRNVVTIGTHPLGIGLCLFEYKPEFQQTWGTGRQFGVMADEVERVMPEAVSVHPDGYRMVNYLLLGIQRGIN